MVDSQRYVEWMRKSTLEEMYALRVIIIIIMILLIMMQNASFFLLFPMSLPIFFFLLEQHSFVGDIFII